LGRGEFHKLEIREWGEDKVQFAAETWPADASRRFPELEENKEIIF
jgi:hypothetical protein